MPDLKFEHHYRGCIIAGVDEAGRGPLAGPVVAGAVIIDQLNLIEGIKDSKLLSAKKREELYELITANYEWGVGIINVDEIDEINILEATKKACIMAVTNLKTSPEIVLIDGNMKFQDRNKFISIIKGDCLSISIAAPSIVAKVTRDRLMLDLHKSHPNYLWKDNMGYGTKAHINAIKNFGMSVHHRKSFKIKY